MNLSLYKVDLGLVKIDLGLKKVELEFTQSKLISWNYPGQAWKPTPWSGLGEEHEKGWPGLKFKKFSGNFSWKFLKTSFSQDVFLLFFFILNLS